MITIIKYCETDGVANLSLDDFKKLDLQKSDDLIWVDIYHDSDEEANEVLSGIFKFHPLAIEDTLKYISANKVHLPKVDDYDKYLFIIFNGICDIKGVKYNIYPLTCFISQKFLVTVHRNKEMSGIVKRFNDSYKKNVFKRGTDYILHLILDEIVDRYYPILDNIETEIDSIEQQVFKRQPDNRSLIKVLNLKKDLLKLRRIASYQKEILFRLSRGDFDEISTEESIYYRNVYDHLVRVTDTVESYRDLTTSLLDSYLSIVNNKMNEIIKFLTIMSTIMLPLTVITGFYGMNFTESMPLLRNPYGVLFSIALMVVVILALLFYFHKRGWFDYRKDI